MRRPQLIMFFFFFCNFLGPTNKTLVSYFYCLNTHDFRSDYQKIRPVMHSFNNVLSAAETPTSDQQRSDETAVSVNGADKLITSRQSIAIHGVLAQYHCYKSLILFDLNIQKQPGINLPHLYLSFTIRMSNCQHVKQKFYRQTVVHLI